MEALLLWPALGCYALAGVAAIAGGPQAAGVVRQHAGLALLLTGLALHTLSIATRWQALGHGPFTTLYEILTSNIWSLTLVFALASVRVRALRPTALVVLPLIGVLAAWMLWADAGPGHFPPTYHTALLYIHTALGKLFLGLLLVAVGVSGVIGMRRTAAGAAHFAAMPNDAALGELAFRFAAAAFVFESLMLIAGATWAQDAWGRYWAWDPLETWAFLTWLALAFTLHARASLRQRPGVYGALLGVVFVLAFLTFFGVPFVSLSPHKGAV
jgi:ABC-type transport system involved in cytochrome c biogenesis permease subunit